MQCFLGCSSLLLYVLSAINGLITQRSVVQIHPPQPNLPFGFNGLSQSHNWLGDSKPNFPAQISGFLYAQFYATPVKGTRFGIFALGECPRWRHRIVADLVLSGRSPRSCSKNVRGDSGLSSP